MKNPIVYITINDLIYFLETRRGTHLSSKDMELHASVILAKFASKQRSEEHWIGFPAKEKMRREFANAENMEDFQQIMTAFVEENSPQDLFLIPESQVENRHNSIPKGNAYQLKRIFSHSAEQSIEDHMVEFLNEAIPKKYAKADHTSLVLLLSSGFTDSSEINIKSVRDRFNPGDYPFEKVMFVTAENNNIITIVEIWPDFGRISYTREQFDSLHG